MFGELDASNISRTFREFESLIGRAELARLTGKVKKEVKRRKIVSQPYLDRYSVTLGLAKAVGYERSTGRAVDPLGSADLFNASTFAAAVVAISRGLSEKARERLSGMVRDSISLDGDARRLDHELNAAASFVNKGWQVRHMDLEGEGNYDFLISRSDLQVEVECKTVGADKGNPIHQMDALNFMEEAHGPLLSKAKDGFFWTVDLTFDLGLPKSPAQHSRLASHLASCMVDGGAKGVFETCRYEITMAPFPRGSHVQVREAVGRRMRQLQDRLNGHVGAIFSDNHALCICVSSERPSKILENTYPEIKKGCEQLSGKRPGCVWTQFVGLSDAELRQLEKEQPNPLGHLSAKIFQNPSRAHVSVLSYSARAELRKTVELVEGGTVRRSSYSRQGALPSHFSSVAAYPLSASAFP